jgi:predicted nicotinamide N-methyase
VAGSEYHITHPLSADDLIDEEEFERDERMPYWAELWTGSIALARHLADRDLAGERMVELGCGVGLPSAVALEQGARVLATDYYDAALDFTVYNARENTGTEPETLLVDWRKPEVLGPGAYGLVVAAEVLYEGRNIRPLVGVIERVLAPGGIALVTESRRPYAAEFLPAFREAGLVDSCEEVAVERDGREVEVQLYSFRKG